MPFSELNFCIKCISILQEIFYSSGKKLRFSNQGLPVQSIISLTLLYSEWPKLCGVLTILSAIVLTKLLVRESLSLLLHIKSRVLKFFVEPM